MSFGDTVSMVWHHYWPLIIAVSAIFATLASVIYLHMKYSNVGREMVCMGCGHHWYSNVWDERFIAITDQIPKCPLCDCWNTTEVIRGDGTKR